MKARCVGQMEGGGRSDTDEREHEREPRAHAPAGVQEEVRGNGSAAGQAGGRAIAVTQHAANLQDELVRQARLGHERIAAGEPSPL